MRSEETAQVRIARDALRRIRELTRSVDALERDLADLARGLAPRLLSERGCGVLTAAKLIGEFAGEARTASPHNAPGLTALARCRWSARGKADPNASANRLAWSS